MTSSHHQNTAEHTSSGWQVHFSYTSTPNTENTHLRQESHCTLNEVGRKPTTVLSENKREQTKRQGITQKKTHSVDRFCMAPRDGGLTAAPWRIMMLGDSGWFHPLPCNSYVPAGAGAGSREAPQNPASALWRLGGSCSWVHVMFL